MSIRTLASGASAWRGYEYYTEKKVLSFTQTGGDEYTGQVAGNGPAPYQVKINTAHPRQSKCNCPHADGRRVICKHMVALFFAAFPEEAEDYIEAVEEYEREGYSPRCAWGLAGVPGGMGWKRALPVPAGSAPLPWPFASCAPGAWAGPLPVSVPVGWSAAGLGDRRACAGCPSAGSASP